MEFKYDGGGLAKGGDVTLYYDGKPVGKGRVEQTQPMGYSADEACDVGSDTGSPASPDYGPTGNRFTGEIEWVQLDIGEDSHDHLIHRRGAVQPRDGAPIADGVGDEGSAKCNGERQSRLHTPSRRQRIRPWRSATDPAAAL